MILHLARLPGIGERTATRLAFYLLRASPQFREKLAESLKALSQVSFCSNCRTLTEESPCRICASPVRKPELLCVVEKPSDIYPIERLGKYNGTYFVLHGLLSPLEGVGPDEIGLQLLFDRVSRQRPEELILALNPTVEGEATVSYVAQKLSNEPVQLSRLASGLPMGSELEFADQITLGKAFEGRTKLR